MPITIGKTVPGPDRNFLKKKECMVSVYLFHHLTCAHVRIMTRLSCEASYGAFPFATVKVRLEK